MQLNSMACILGILHPSFDGQWSAERRIGHLKVQGSRASMHGCSRITRTGHANIIGPRVHGPMHMSWLRQRQRCLCQPSAAPVAQRQG